MAVEEEPPGRNCLGRYRIDGRIVYVTPLRPLLRVEMAMRGGYWTAISMLFWPH